MAAMALSCHNIYNELSFLYYTHVVMHAIYQSTQTC